MNKVYTLTQGDFALSFTVERKTVKHTRIYIHPDLRVRVVTGQRTTLTEIREALLRQREPIQKALSKFEAKRALIPRLSLLTGETLPIFGRTRTVVVQTGKTQQFDLLPDTLLLTVRDETNPLLRRKCFDAFVDYTVKKHFTAETERLLPLFSPHPPKLPTLAFRRMKTKWGVCVPQKQKITFNKDLLFLPPELAEYVVCHELAHFHVSHHGADFWQFLSLRMPDCKERRKALNAYPVPTFDI